MSLFILVFGIVLGIVFAGVGARLVYRKAVGLKWRFATYAALTIGATLEETTRRITIAQRGIDRLPMLFTRAQRAMAEIDTARNRIADMAGRVGASLRRPTGP